MPRSVTKHPKRRIRHNRIHHTRTQRAPGIPTPARHVDCKQHNPQNYSQPFPTTQIRTGTRRRKTGKPRPTTTRHEHDRTMVKHATLSCNEKTHARQKARQRNHEPPTYHQLGARAKQPTRPTPTTYGSHKGNCGKWYTNSHKFCTQPRQRQQHPNHTTGHMARTHDELENPIAHQASDEDTCEGKQYALDSGAHPSHVSKPTPNMKPLRKIIRTNTATTITPPATHKGMIHIPTSTNRNIRIPAISNPAMRSNLLSVHDIPKQWGEVRFTPTQATVLDTSTHPPQIVDKARFRRGMYYLELPQEKSQSMAARTIPTRPTKKSKSPPTQTKKPLNQKHKKDSSAQAKPSDGTWTRRTASKKIPLHQAHNPAPPPHTPAHPAVEMDFHHYHVLFNHIRPTTLQKMAKLGLLPNIPPTLRQRPPSITCSSCAAAKQQPAPHYPKIHKYQVGAAFSSDICGPFNPTSRQGNKYILTVIDTRSRYLIVDFLQSRAETPHRLDVILTALKPETGANRHCSTQTMRKNMYQTAPTLSTGLTMSCTAQQSHTPQQNEIAKRINSTLMNPARAALYHSSLPNTHWEETRGPCSSASRMC